MAMVLKDQGKRYSITPSGVHPAICVGVIDLGTHYNEMFSKESRKVLLMFEIVKELLLLDDGSHAPRIISGQYTYSFAPKANLRKLLEGWRGKTYTDEQAREGVDLEKCLGRGCLLSVMHTVKGDKTFANIAAAMPLPKDAPRMEPHNEPLFFEVGSGPIPETLPEWIQAKISCCLELSGDRRTTGPTPTDQQEADDIPF